MLEVQMISTLALVAWLTDQSAPNDTTAICGQKSNSHIMLKPYCHLARKLNADSQMGLFSL